MRPLTLPFLTKPARYALTALPLLGSLLLTGSAFAQTSPFGQPQPQPGPFGQPPPQQAPFGQQPQPQQPQPQPFGGQPGGQFGQPQQPAPFGQQPQPGFNDPNVPPYGPTPQYGQGQWGQPQPGFGPPPAEEAAPPSPEAIEAERSLSLMEQTSISGSTGLLHTLHAGSGEAGTFRVGFMSDWFSVNNFLCNPNHHTAAGVPITCGANNASDHASHVGGYFTINATPFSFLEAYASLRTYANYDSQGSPQLLEVLGDTTFGVKGYTPKKIGKYFTFGADAALQLLNGSGGVGVSGAATSALFRALASADLRQPEGKGFPFRVDVNVGYHLDNSGQLVLAVEKERATAFTDGRTFEPITRIERYGLGINQVDQIPIDVGFSFPFAKVQPYAEYSIDVPTNRQGYECHTGHVSKGDVCLGLANFAAADPQTAGGPGIKAYPSRVTIGVRTNPFDKAFHGLSAHAAFDIGVTGTSTFIEEMAPQAPWTLYLGLGYSFDTKEKELPPPPPAPVAAPPPPPENFVRGYVHELNKPAVPVAEAIVYLDGVAQPPVATGPDGRFMTRNLEPGVYRFNIKAKDFKPGVCQATVVAGGAQPLPPQFNGQFMTPQAFGGQPGMQPPPSAFGQPAPAPFGAPQPGMPGQPGATQMPEPPHGPNFVDIDCGIEAAPRASMLIGSVKDGETSAAVAGAVIQVTDATGKQVGGTADGAGNFILKDVPFGTVLLKAEAPGYMPHGDQIDIRAGQENHATVIVNKRPKIGLVKLEGKEIRILKQVHFETDSAKIVADSSALLEEVAEVFQKHPSVLKVEIQGHTDNTGSSAHNKELSEARANAVRTWLVAAGVNANRLTAKGYGQDRPLAPNVTPGNRAKNRRVQFIILEGK